MPCQQVDPISLSMIRIFSRTLTALGGWSALLSANDMQQNAGATKEVDSGFEGWKLDVMSTRTVRPPTLLYPAVDVADSIS
jgi:hypothetical protein